VSTFADREVIALLRDAFVPVAGDDWYQRRRDDAEGQFFRRVADQGPRKGRGGSTRQGIYVLTAGGRLLAFSNHRDPGVMKSVLARGLRAWQQLPAAERRPGAIEVPPLAKTDPRFTRRPPAGGLIVDVHARILDRDKRDELCRGSCRVPGGDQASHDHLWLTEAEWRGLVPASAKVGDSFPLPRRLLLRIVRFHLVDNTRGEPPFWSARDVRQAEGTLTVEEAGPAGIKLRLKGRALLATNADPKRAERGFDVALLGYLHYNAGTKALDRFDVVAVGEHWGDGTFTRSSRPGRTPLGVAFRLARGSAGADRVPPQASREWRSYLEPDRE
jgi:hypothetical protein